METVDIIETPTRAERLLEIERQAEMLVLSIHHEMEPTESGLPDVLRDACRLATDALRMVRHALQVARAEGESR